MDKLEFPVSKDSGPPTRRLSMDEYLEFVMFCWQNVPDRERLRKQRMREAPKVPFRLK